jgi:hypothetical protein
VAGSDSAAALVGDEATCVASRIGRRARRDGRAERLLERVPELPSVLEAVGRLDGERARQHLLDGVIDHDPEPARRGSAVWVGRGDVELHGVVAVERASAREQLHEHEREREDIGPGTGGAAPLVELLRRSVLRGEGGGRLRRARGRSGESRLLGEHLGDPEVEQLRHEGPVGPHQHDVLGLDVAVHDSLPVRERERACHRTEQRHGRGEGHGALATCPPVGEESGHGLPLEPLEHEVGQPPAGARLEGTGVERLHDRRAALREPMQDRTLFLQAREEPVALFGLERVGHVEALDGDGLAKGLVGAAVDDTEASSAHEALDAVLARDGRAAKAVRIANGLGDGVVLAHGRQGSGGAAGRTTPLSGSRRGGRGAELCSFAERSGNSSRPWVSLAHRVRP